MIFFKNLKKEGIFHGILERKEAKIRSLSDYFSILKFCLFLKKQFKKDIKVEDLVFAQQIHKNKVYFLKEKERGGIIKLGVDGILTREKGKILVLRTADCLPILLYSKKEKLIGAIHAGKKGLFLGILEKAFKFLPKDSTIVGIGPHIRVCCYSQKNVKKGYEKFYQKRKGKIYLDLTKLAIEKMITLGIKKENIEDLGICTFCQNDRFFSYRKGERYRFLSFIGIL